MDEEKKRSIKAGIEASIPIILGYFPIAIAFGVLARNTELSLADTGLFSIFVFAGASQFMALDLIREGIGPISIIFATFLINLRHLVMSASLSTKFNEIPRSSFPIIAFGITDETFSMLSFTKERIDLIFALIVTITGYFFWVFGSVVGYILGDILPATLQDSLGVGLYGTFIAILIPQFKGSRKNLIVSILAIVTYIGVSKIHLFKMGWDLIVAIVVTSILGVLIFDREKEVDSGD